MIIQISSYDGNARVVSFSKTDDSYAALCDNHLNIAKLCDKALLLSPDNVRIDLTESEYNKFLDSADFDVFEIDADGNAYKYFDASSLDNAIMVTNKCNSNCLMCPTPEAIRKKDIAINVDYLIHVAQHFPKDAEHITITGGEPFLAGRDIFKLFDYLKGHFPVTDFLVLTNGRIFSVIEYTDRLAETQPGNTILGIPLHGFNDATHDSITQSAGSFRQTYQGLKNLLSRGIRVELRIVVSKLNMDFITGIAQLIVNEFKGAECVKIMGLEMTGNAAKNKDSVWISYKEAFEKAQPAIDILTKAGIDVGLYNFPLCSVNENYRSICEKSISDYKIRFAPECDRCTEKDACGGMFSGTIRLSKDDIIPIRNS